MRSLSPALAAPMTGAPTPNEQSPRAIPGAVLLFVRRYSSSSRGITHTLRKETGFP